MESRKWSRIVVGLLLVTFALAAATPTAAASDCGRPICNGFCPGGYYIEIDFPPVRFHKCLQWLHVSPDALSLEAVLA